MTAQKPVSQRIIDQIVRKLKAMNSADNNGIKFAYVKTNALDHTQKFSNNAASVLDLGVQYVYQTSYLETNMQLGIEIWMKLNETEQASDRYRIARAEIHKVLAGLDTNLAETDDAGVPNGEQLTMNIQVLSDDPDIGTDNDRLISGMFQFNVVYRTAKADPYQLM